MNSLIKPIELLEKTKQLGQSAVAITDHGTLAGAWDALQAFKKTGIKPIIGCEFSFVDDVKKESKLRHIILLAKNHVGYKNLLLASKLANDNHIIAWNKSVPRIDWNILEKCSDGLICITACSGGILGQLINTKRKDLALEQAKRLKKIFGDSLAFEIQPHAMYRNASPFNDYDDQMYVNNTLVKFGEELNVKVVVTTNAHYVDKEDWEMHDALLAIGYGVQVRSVARLKYPSNDFYMKSEEEIRKFLFRYYGTLADEIIANTVHFADMCEDPEWIDPKFSNPSGKELPVFPVKDQEDYDEFIEWQASTDYLLGLDEDVAYLRYLCEKGLNEKILNSESTLEKEKKYRDRLEEEFDVIEYRGIASYMLIVADFINYAKNNNIPIGPGRGCLGGNTMVFSSKGFKKLKDISIGDYVYSHTGDLRKVINSFKYDVKDEELLNIKTEMSFNTISLTKDHKVFGFKNEKELISKISPGGFKCKYSKNKTPSEPKWLEAKNLNVGDFLFFTFPKRQIKNIKNIDLLKICKNATEKDLSRKLYIRNNLSIRSVSKNTIASFDFVRKLKYNLISKTKLNKHLYEAVEFYLDTLNLSLKDWKDYKNYKEFNLNQIINIDEDFIYFIGRWIGDGCFHGINQKRGITISFNADDSQGILKISFYLKKIGLSPSINRSKISKAVNLTITNKFIFNLFKFLFPNYSSSETKYIPDLFKSLNDNLLKSLLGGLIDSDGYKINKEYCKLTTISEKLALDVKEILAYLKIPSSIFIQKNPKRYGITNKTSFIVNYHNNINHCGVHFYKNGYFCKITEISSVNEDYVYDINVDKDFSYLTSNYIVHNSAGGSLISYLVGIHDVDSIKYNLLFARFLNKFKNDLADIDIDIAPSGRFQVQKYIRDKYGDDHVAHISNVNTMTPKVYARDIARAFQFGGNREAAVEIGTNIADSIPIEIKTVSRALEKAALFAEYASHPKYGQLKKFAKLSGIEKVWSTHAAGLVISKRPLVEFIPLRRDKDENIAIEYEKNRAEQNGLVKMDLLGLETLDIIETTYNLIKLNGKTPRRISYHEYDKSAYDLISRGDTLCVFQLGTSAGTMDLCKKIQPKCIEDISAINSLARPAARDIRADFIDAKNGVKKFELMNTSLERAFKSTFGFGLYEECLMFIAQDVAGWDLNDADSLRKLTKDKGKYPEKIKKLKEKFIEDSETTGVGKEMGKKIWEEVIANFGGYGFNACLHFSELVDIYTNKGEFIGTKQIKDVQIGEYVKSRDEESGNDVFVSVINNHNNGISPLVEIQLDSGEKIKCTMNHKFRVKENGEMYPLWKIIKENYSIVVNTMSSGVIKSVLFIDDGQTYDLEVNHKDHQFYLSNGVLSSNSHSISYSLISYHTAYLKANFPLEFLVANLMSEVDSNAKISANNIAKIKSEIRQMNIKILPPDINSSSNAYTISKNGTLITGLNSLKYMGKDSVPEIIKHRPFSSFEDFLSKVDGRLVRSPAVQAMAASGCLDDFGFSRKQMFLYASDYKKKLAVWNKKNSDKPFIYHWPNDTGEWTKAEMYAMEDYYIGEGLCCGIKDAYPNFFDNWALDLSKLGEIFPDPGEFNEKFFIPAKLGVVEGVIRSIFEFKVKKETSKIFGQTMAKMEIEDPLGNTASMTLFPNGLETFNERLRSLAGNKAELKPGIAVHCAASINWYEGEASLVFDNLKRAVLEPPRPKDLKPRTISMKTSAEKRIIKKTDKIDANKFLEIVEDELIEDGIS